MQEAPRCDAAASPDYVAGFRDGFVDYVYAGGTGEPPPVPPRRYWNVGLRSPGGKARANDWFAGFRHGARSAHDGGYREMGTVRGMLAGYPRGAQSMNSYAAPEETYSPPAGPTNPFSAEDPVESLPDPASKPSAEVSTLPPPSTHTEEALPTETPLQNLPAKNPPPVNHDEPIPPPQLPPAHDHPTTFEQNSSEPDDAANAAVPAELELPQEGKSLLPIPPANEGWKPTHQNTEALQSRRTAVSPAIASASHNRRTVQTPLEPQSTTVRIVKLNVHSPHDSGACQPSKSKSAVTQASFAAASEIVAGSCLTPLPDSGSANDVAPSDTMLRPAQESKSNTIVFKR